VNRRQCHFFAFGLVLASACSGCYHKSTVQDTVVFGFAWWLQAVVVLGSILAFPAGWFLYKKWAKGGFVLMGMAPILLVIVMPMMFLDKVEVRPDGFQARWGIWFAPQSAKVEFTSVTVLELQPEQREDRLGQHSNYRIVCTLRDGGTETIPVGDLMRSAVRDIIDRASKKGVQIRGEGLADRM